jgi:hypothetical protein
VRQQGGDNGGTRRLQDEKRVALATGKRHRREIHLPDGGFLVVVEDFLRLFRDNIDFTEEEVEEKSGELEWRNVEGGWIGKMWW